MLEKIVDSSLAQYEERPAEKLLPRLVKNIGYRRLISLIARSAPIQFHTGLDNLWSWREDFSLNNRAINDECKLDFNLTGTVDIYPYQHASLFARGYKWNPRPVIESYSAYTPELIRLDEQHLRNSDAPDHLIFRLESIDQHFPSLEDGLSWPAVLDNYTVAGSSESWILLNRKNRPIKKTSSYISLSKVSAHLGEEVSVPEVGGPIFMELNEKLSNLGKLVDLAYKVPPLSLRVTERNGKQFTYRVNANMMKTGFIVSPLVTTDDEFFRLFDPNTSSSEQNTVTSFALQVSGGRSIAWRNDYAVAFMQYKF